MPISQQITKSLSFSKLKGVNNLEEISFDQKPLTAIMGTNGSGKSTILHALACCYKPPPGSDCRDWKFSNFFTPTTHDTWKGSLFTMRHSYRDGTREILNEESTYQKSADRWSPKYARRPERHVNFVGIKSCVPKIEEENAVSSISFTTSPHADTGLIREKLGYIFNKTYNELNTHKASRGRSYSGLVSGDVKYSSLAMGAGEQRVIEILSAAFNAPKYGMILIDEIDLLLHTDALQKLISVLSDRATEKNLQIIFTSHRESIINQKDIVSIKHLHSIKENGIESTKTLCLSNSTPDALYRLTGVMVRSIEIFVEDYMAKAIVEHEASRLGLKKHTDTVIYGAAVNCFTVLGGLALTNRYDPKTQVYVLDGDVLTDVISKESQIQKVVSGTEVGREDFRKRCLSGIRQFQPSDDAPSAPEAQIHRMIRSLDPQLLDASQKEIFDISSNINVEQDKHYLVQKILMILNESEPSGLPKIVATAALSAYWPTYVQEITTWLENAGKNIKEE